jgi:hypothetical protein
MPSTSYRERPAAVSRGPFVRCKCHPLAKDGPARAMRHPVRIVPSEWGIQNARQVGLPNPSIDRVYGNVPLRRYKAGHGTVSQVGRHVS